MPILRFKGQTNEYLALITLVSSFVLQACSNTQIGQDLANSFDTPGNSLGEETLSKSQVTSRSSDEKKVSIRKDTKAVNRMPQVYRHSFLPTSLCAYQ